MLDVGQGLSIVIQTKHHALLYDAGAKFGDQFDMGESVVLPYLRAVGIKNLDMIMISHGDNDHLGGAFAVLHEIPTKQILTSVPEKIRGSSLCLAGTNWNWDDVNFQIIYPYNDTRLLGNDSSCVLKIDNGKQSILLTGDIEKFAENQLLTRHQNNLSSNILVAPHHGSKTSSQTTFIAAIHPQYVIYATGYKNRYHFPHNIVVERYTAAGVLQLNTMETGAIEFKLNGGELIPKIKS